MKIIDQYIQAIGQKLPLKGRNDVKMELKSLLWDDIESKYGEEPTDDEVKQAIADFGTPRQVAAKYSGERLVIASGFTDIYFLIFGIMIFAMAVAFTVIFFINLFTNDMSSTEILKGIGQIILNTWNASIAGIGMMTIVFIIITRFIKESVVDLDDDWKPEDLKGVELGDEVESKIESFVSIFFLLLMLVLVNMFPQLISLAESSFELNGVMKLGNHMIVERFATYAILLSLIWMTEIVYHIILLRAAVKTRAIEIFRTVIDLVGIVLLVIMILDPKLFVTNQEATLPSFVGFKGVFLIVVVISIIELLVKSVKAIIKKMEK